MKISKVTWIFVIIGVVLIAGTSLGMAHSRQTDQQKQLEDKIAQAQLKAAVINNDELLTRQSQLNTQIKSYSSQLESTKQKISSNEDSISATDRLLVTGNSTNLQVGLLSSPGFSTETIGGAACNILSLDIQVEGDINDINRFIKELSRQYPTSIIKSVAVTNEEAPAEIISTEEGGEVPEPVIEDSSEPITRANLNLVIYDYRELSLPRP